jgi:hypothetical protein
MGGEMLSTHECLAGIDHSLPKPTTLKIGRATDDLYVLSYLFFDMQNMNFNPQAIVMLSIYTVYNNIAIISSIQFVFTGRDLAE